MPFLINTPSEDIILKRGKKAHVSEIKRFDCLNFKRRNDLASL